METIISGWRRSMMAGERVRERCCRAAAALDSAGVRYAVIGGNAVAEWVGRKDSGATRYTKDVDILVERGDLDAVIAALERDGFEHHNIMGLDAFLDGPDCKPSEGIHLLFAGEKVKPTDAIPAPSVDDSERALDFNVISLEGIVAMKLISHRDKDRTHLRDMIGVGLIDETWPARFANPLNERLQHLFDTPNG